MRRIVAIGLGVQLLLANALFAQDAGVFGVRLDWVPISGAERNDVAGTRLGRRATLSRSRLADQRLLRRTCPPPRRRASLHHGVATGARGPAIAELTITKHADGTFDGQRRPDARAA